MLRGVCREPESLSSRQVAASIQGTNSGDDGGRPLTFQYQSSVTAAIKEVVVEREALALLRPFRLIIVLVVVRSPTSQLVEVIQLVEIVEVEPSPSSSRHPRPLRRRSLHASSGQAHR